MNIHDILLGFDDPQMLEGIGWALKEDGQNVTTVSSTHAVLEAFKRKTYDLLLIDFDFDKTLNLDVLHTVKELHPKTIVIMLCSKNDVINYHDALQVEADDYIFKPCSKAKLWESVTNCLERLELQKICNSLDPNSAQLSKCFLKLLQTTLEEVKNPLAMVQEILELLKWGAYGRMDQNAKTKLDEVHKIVLRLNGTIEGQLENIPANTGEFNIPHKIQNWKEDILSPALGNVL